MGKAMARRSKRKIAVEALSDDQIKKHIIAFIGKDIAEEVKTLSSDLSKSILTLSPPSLQESFNKYGMIF